MTWLQFLNTAEWLSVIGVNVTVLYCIYPIYKRTRSRALVLLGYAYLIGTFDVVCNHTIGAERMTYKIAVTYRTFHYLIYIGVTLLGGIGLLKLLNAFLKLHESKFGPPEDGGTPSVPLVRGGFLRRFFRAMTE